MTVYFSSSAWELSSILYFVAMICGFFCAVFLWLALTEYHRACRRVERACASPGAHRRAFDFDLFRAFSFASFAWCALMVIMALEPRLWLVEVESRQFVYIGWIVIALGWMLGLGLFAIGRVQELFGLHRFQRLRLERDLSSTAKA